MGVTAGASLAANALFGDSKLTQVAREAYARAPDCSARPNGIPNGRILMFVRNIGWYSYYPLPDGRGITASSGHSLVVIGYEISDPGDRDVLVNPERALLTDAEGKIAEETAGLGGQQAGSIKLDADAALKAGEGWQKLAVFDVAPGEYALLAPNGRATDEPNPHQLVGCRFPAPSARP